MIIRYGGWLLFLLLLTFYTYTSFRLLFQHVFVRWVYLGLSITAVCGLLIFFSLDHLRSYIEENFWIAVVFSLMMGFVIMQVLWSAFILVDDVRALVVFLVRRIAHFFNPPHSTEGVRLSRSLFLQWLSFGIGAALFGTLAWGIKNRYNYQLRKHRIRIEGLPDGWKGLKIVQLSDIHSGSFSYSNYEDVKRGIDLANAQKADLILFTGDLVNNEATEFIKWQSLFTKLNAPMGVYSILGNHDYGDYKQWESPEAKVQNLEHLKKLQLEMGWKLLCNESVLLQRDGVNENIALVGVENWSAKKNFPKYGDLAKALSNVAHTPIKILMSHDPSHWDAQVRKHPSIKLMLAGHTHGMQFGLETPFFRWSPVQWVYQQWAGLYRSKQQYLYINRGFGFLGYPGRVGIMPEITSIELV